MLPPLPVALDRVRADWLPSIVAGVFTLVTAIAGFYMTVFFKEDLSFSGQQIGILSAVQAVTGVLAAFPAGAGNDRITSRTLMAVSLLALAGGFALLVSVHSFLPFVLVYFLWGLAINLCKLSQDAQILKSDTGTHTAERVGLYQAWRFGGVTVGTVLTGYLLAWIDFRSSLLLVGGVCLALVLFSTRLWPTPVGKTRLSDYIGDVSDPAVIFFALWMFLFTTHWGAEGTSYSLFLRQNLKLSFGQMGWYIGSEYFTVMVTVLLLARQVARPGNLRRFAIIGIVASGSGMIGMALTPVFPSVAFRMLHGFGDGIMQLILFMGLFKLFSPERLGGNAGFFNTMMMAGFVAGSLVYGPLGESQGYALPLWISGAITLVLALPLLSHRYARALD